MALTHNQLCTVIMKWMRVNGYLPEKAEIEDPKDPSAQPAAVEETWDNVSDLATTIRAYD